MNLDRKSAPRWTAPVPETVWNEATLFSFIAGLSGPRISFCAADVNSARPAMGRYSWLTLGSFRMRSSAYHRLAHIEIVGG